MLTWKTMEIATLQICTSIKRHLISESAQTITWNKHCLKNSFTDKDTASEFLHTLFLTKMSFKMKSKFCLFIHYTSQKIFDLHLFDPKYS